MAMEGLHRVVDVSYNEDNDEVEAWDSLQQNICRHGIATVHKMHLRLVLSFRSILYSSSCIFF